MMNGRISPIVVLVAAAPVGTLLLIRSDVGRSEAARLQEEAADMRADFQAEIDLLRVDLGQAINTVGECRK